MSRRNQRVGCGIVAAAWACLLPAVHAEGPIVLRDVTRQTGINFRHTDGSSGQHFIVEVFASGLATFDYDGDGLLDIYFLNGRPLRGASQPAVPPKNRLYRNLGGFRFVDVTEQTRVADAGYGLGVAIGDYDNDGRPDIYVSNFGPNVLYRNRGDGTFSDVTAQAAVARGDTIGAGANFLDIDEDGCLDLFVANYASFTYENHYAPIIRGRPWYTGPRHFPQQANNLFRNRGDGAFADVTRESGIGAHAGAGMGSIGVDYDNDGHTDILVCNDQAWNFLFRGDGAGRFKETALAAGLACNFLGETVANMGADCGDYNHDGLLDLFVTDYAGQSPILFKNLGSGTFEDATVESGAGAGSVPYVKWGCGLIDFDNDGFQDIFIGCGHLSDDLDLAFEGTAYEVCPILLRNTGDGKFVNVSQSAGDGLKVKLVARGIAFDDLDNDGRIDVVILNSRRAPTILRNESMSGNHWLQVRLRGVKTNRDGVGAHVKITAGDLSDIAEVHSGRSYQSHYGSRLHFGLGRRNRVDRIEVRWIGGGVDVFEDVAADQAITLVEGSGRPTP